MRLVIAGLHRAHNRPKPNQRWADRMEKMERADWTMSVIKGVENPEDIAVIPGTEWIVTSAYSDAAIPEARSFFVNTRTHEVRIAYPDNCIIDLDCDRFSDVEPPEVARFHGLDVSSRDGSITLYQVNHPVAAGPGAGAGRESVEVFEVDVDNGVPQLRWRGAVISPSWVSGNDLCALPEGGFAMTNSYFKSSEGLDMAFAGRISGNVLEWRNRAEGWVIAEGTDLNAPNGIAVSPDGRYYFIAAWAVGKLVRVSRSDPHGSRFILDTGALIDNITWTGDGHLLLAGQVIDAQAARGGFGAGAAMPLKVIKVDPKTMAQELVLFEERSLCWPTTALEVGKDIIWVGAVHSRELLVYSR